MRLTADLDDIGGMPATRALRVKGMDRAAFHGGNGILNKAAFIECVGVDHHLNIHGIGNVQAIVDRRRCRPPVFMQFQRTGPRRDLFLKRGGQGSIALTGEGKVHGKTIG